MDMIGVTVATLMNSSIIVTAFHTLLHLRPSVHVVSPTLSPPSHTLCLIGAEIEWWGTS